MAASQFDPQNSEGINDINITPFVDVVLVLLVIFMVTAPMMMKDIIGLELPKVSQSDAQSATTLGIAVTSQGQLLLNGELVSDESLKAAALSAVEKNPDVQAVISADSNSRHMDFVRVIDIIKSVGLENFAIQVEKQKENL